MSKALALLLLMLALAVVAEITVVPLWSLYQSRERAAEALRRDLYRFELLADSADAGDALVERLRRARALEGLAFAEPNPGQASAALQDRLKALVAGGGGKLLSIQSLPDTEAGAYRKIGARARVQATAEALPEIVYAIESDHPYLFVDELAVSGRGRGKTRRPTPIGVSLDVRLTVSGYAEQEEGG